MFNKPLAKALIPYVLFFTFWYPNLMCSRVKNVKFKGGDNLKSVACPYIQPPVSIQVLHNTPNHHCCLNTVFSRILCLNAIPSCSVYKLVTLYRFAKPFILFPSLSQTCDIFILVNHIKSQQNTLMFVLVTWQHETKWKGVKTFSSNRCVFTLCVFQKRFL